MDEKNALLFLDSLDESFQNSAVILITHSIDIAGRCNKIVVMYAGMIMEYGDAKEILRQAVHPYTQSLIHALPENGFEIYQNPDGIQSKQGALSMLNAQLPKIFVLSRFLNCIRLIRFGGGAFLSDIFFRAEHSKMHFYAGNKQKQVVTDDASFTVEQVTVNWQVKRCRKIYHSKLLRVDTS